jgi:hypothetical protein
MTDQRTLWLAFGCIIFAATIAAEVRQGGDLTSVAAGKPVSSDPAPRPRPSRVSPPETLTADALARPLFNPTRRPVSSGGPASADFADKRLAGIVVSPQQRLAIFAVTGDKPLVVKEGADIDGWQIETITPFDVSLRGPGGTRTLRPKMDASPMLRPGEIAGANHATPPPNGAGRRRQE